MGDHDWELWQSAWQGVNGALPDVKARASAASARHRLDSVLLAVVLGAGTIGAATGVATGGPATQLVCAGNIAFTALFLAAYFLIQRDLGRARDSAPREAVAFLERRVRLERRTAQLARWMTLAMLAFLFAFGGWRDHLHRAVVGRLAAGAVRRRACADAELARRARAVKAEPAENQSAGANERTSAARAAISSGERRLLNDGMCLPGTPSVMIFSIAAASWAVCQSELRRLGTCAPGRFFGPLPSSP